MRRLLAVCLLTSLALMSCDDDPKQTARDVSGDSVVADVQGDLTAGDSSSDGIVDVDVNVEEDTRPPIDPTGWQPPIGIPEPEFGIRELSPELPEPWDTSAAGFYYIDNSHAAATDDNNPMGSRALPRLTIPRALVAGDTVVVNGGPYDGNLDLSGAGTEAAPIFVRSDDPEHPAILVSRVSLSGSYLLMEHFDFDGPSAGVTVRTPSDHMVVRHSEVHNGEGGGSGLYTGRWNPEDEPAEASHVVFFDNVIHDNGDVLATFDEDHHAVAVGHHANHVWILDSVMFLNSGDGVQVNAKKAYLMDTLHHVYVGRNTAHHNKQTGFWSKQSVDTVFSQNTVYGMRPSNSSGGAGIGFQYGPERLWLLYNEVYDCELGITSSTNVGDEDGVAGAGQDVYIVGNVLHDIHKEDGSGAVSDPWQAGAGLHFTDQTATKHVVNNTVYDTDVSLTYARGIGGLEVVNNVFAAAGGYHLRIEMTEAAAASSMHHTLFDTAAQIRWDSQAMDVAAFVAANPGACEGCLEADPQFVDVAANDFSVAPTSPAVDAGTASEVYSLFEALYGLSIAVDFAGEERVGTYDIGAFEAR